MKLYRVAPKGKGGKSQTGAHTPGELMLPHAPQCVVNVLEHAARFSATPTTVGLQVPPLQHRQSQLLYTCSASSASARAAASAAPSGLDIVPPTRGAPRAAGPRRAARRRALCAWSTHSPIQISEF